MKHLLLLALSWALLLHRSLVAAQNLTDEQVAVVSQRLNEGAQKSWELGTRSQTILEVNATLYSVFSNNALPPPSVPPDNLTAALSPFFTIARDVVSRRANATVNATGLQPLVPGDGSAGDPASIGMSVLLANWTVQTGDVKGVDYASAARDQLDFLLNIAPRTSDGAISHRTSMVQLWSDFVYMVPPFLAYYGVMTENRTLLLEAYNQIMLYRKYLCDTEAHNRWKHILLGVETDEPSNDEGHWTTGNGWAAAGILRVLGTIRNSQYANTLKGQQKDLGNWVKEIHDGMFAVLNGSVNVFTNYPDIPPDSSGNFYDASGSALLASTVFRGAVMLDQFTHVPAAERIRRTLFSPSGNTPQNSTSSNVSSVFENYSHLTMEGWLTPVVNPDSFGKQGSQSPEAQAFVLQLHSSWRDWVADGARGANAGTSVRLGRMSDSHWMWFLYGGWIWFVCGGFLGLSL